VTHSVTVKDFVLGAGNPLFLIGGPCVLEDEQRTLDIGRRIRDVCRRLGIPYVFKSSYDKANRTNLRSYRGPGISEGLDQLGRLKDELGVPILVDVHDTSEIEPAAEVADILQVPAFLCRQTDFVQAVASAGRPVNVKKGQFLTPWDMINVVEKVEDTGNSSILLTERGASFGYNNLVVDFRSFPVLSATGYPVVFDVTHSVQLPGGKGDKTGGQREFIAPLARAAVAAGIDGLFMEIHPKPDEAPCDGDSMLALDDLEPLLEDVLAIRQALVKPTR